MMRATLEKTIIQNAFCWGGALLTPPIVMVILDLFDRHTPTSVAVFSSITLMFLFGISHAVLVKNLNGDTTSEKKP